MNHINRNYFFPAIIVFILAVCGCATGNVITLSEDGPSRPAANEVPKVAGSPKVAIMDFSWDPNPSFEIGRDFDNVRSIVWKGNPGKSIADLMAGVLAEQGIPAVRAAREENVPEGVPARVWGRVEEFQVNAKRAGMGTYVDIESNISLKLEGSAQNVPAGWNTTVNTSYRHPEPLFLMSGDILHVVNRASNELAEEAVRQLIKAGFTGSSAAAPEPQGIVEIK